MRTNFIGCGFVRSPEKRKQMAIARFVKRVKKTEGCWLWLRTKGDRGRGVCYIGGKFHLASAAAYKLFIGPIEKGKEVCHSCDNPKCVNHQHLFLGTHQDNMDDMVRKNRQVKGERVRNAKLTSELVRMIRSDTRKHVELARELGVSSNCISMVRRKLTWTHTT